VSAAVPVVAARSLLFVPGDGGARLAGAAGRGADALVIDLEDAVAPEAKDAARAAAVEHLRGARPAESLLVRINAPDTPWFEADVHALRDADIDAVLLPKADAAALADLGDLGHPVVALVETAAGVEDARAVARDARVIRLMLGSADLAHDVGFELTADEGELHYARSRVAFASAAAGIAGGIDVVHLDVRDDDGLGRSAVRARALGFSGKACIHPAQLATVNRAFSPTADEIALADRVVAAFDEAVAAGAGAAILVDGRLVDRPVVERARRTLARTESMTNRERTSA
jgi:citrate lyase subunit beta / citryl-CoA lyase